LDRDVYVPVANMKYAKCASGSVSINGKLVVCGGFDRGECLNKVEAYNAEINAWEKWPSMLSKRGRFDATVVDDKLIYAVGGSNGHSEEASVEVYDPEAGKWAHGPSLPVALSNIGLSSLDGVVYCIGGSNGSTGSKVCFKLKPGSPKWQRIADLHIGRFQAAVVAFEGRLGSGRLRELESLKFLGNLRASDRHLEHRTFTKHSQARLWSGCSQRTNLGGGRHRWYSFYVHY